VGGKSAALGVRSTVDIIMPSPAAPTVGVRDSVCVSATAGMALGATPTPGLRRGNGEGGGRDSHKARNWVEEANTSEGRKCGRTDAWCSHAWISA
jgi:hypothetical protein